MTAHPTFPIQSHTSLNNLSFAALRQVLKHQAQEHELPVLEDSETAFVTEVPSFGLYRFTPDGANLDVQIWAALPDRLFTLKESFTETLTHLMPDAAKALRWQDNIVDDSSTAPDSTKRPPNLHFTTVQSITPVGTAFLRVRVKTEDLTSFQDDAIHFRLLLPAANCQDPEWPSLADNGTTVWPKGDKALHRPVYTTRWVDPDGGLMDLDIFLHDGGRATEWVRQASPGDTLVIAGPGGGGIPDTSKILMFGDETAFPAIARILEGLHDASTGQVILVAEEGADCAYPISAPPGIEIHWLRHSEATDLSDRALKAHDAHPDHYFWFACEKTQVSPVRAVVKASRPTPTTSYVAA